MKLKTVKLISLLPAFLYFFCGLAALAADNTVSRPVSAAIPGVSFVNADITSRPVSVWAGNATFAGSNFFSYPVSANAVSPGLSASYPMDNSWNDASGNGNNGTPTGATFSTNRKYGTHSGNFDGNDYVTLKSSTLIANKTQSTIEAWVYPSGTCTDTGTVYSENISGGVVFYLQITCAGTALFGIWRSDQSPNARNVYSSIPILRDTWNHVAATLDSSGMKIYINGVFAGLNTSNLPTNQTINTVLAGRIVNSNGTNYFKGQIDDLAVYDRSLTAEEIAAHSSVVADYRMENNWIDSVNGNTGSSSNAAFSASGKIGSAGSFDGTSSYVEVPHTENYNFTREFSAAFWLKAQSAQNQSFVLTDKAGSNTGFSVKGGANGALTWGFGTGSDFTSVTSKINLKDDNWHYVVGTYDGSALKIYIDGYLNNSKPENRDMVVNSSSLTIGGKSGGTEVYSGLIDELKIYRTALREVDILRSYDSSIKAFYKMESNWVDSSGTNGTGVPYNNVTFSNNFKSGSASGSFDGVNDYVLLRSSELISKTSESTIEAWVLPDCLQSGVVYSENTTGGTVYHMYAGCYGVSFSIKRSSAWYTVTSGKRLIPGIWNHVAATLDSSGMKIYINGELAAHKTDYNLPSDNTISEVNVGRTNNSGGADFFKGLIDDLKVYNRSLTDEELNAKFNGGRNVYYKFENNLEDSSGNNLNGSLLNGTGFSSSSKKDAYAAHLDGIDNYMLVPHSTPFDMTRTLSVSYWVKAAAEQNAVFTLLDKSSDAEAFTGWFMQGNADGNISWGFGNGTDFASTVTASVDIRDNKWHLITGTYDGADLKIYIDGVLNNIKAETSDIALNAGPFYIGGTQAGDGFKGLLDELAVYSYALNEAEVKRLFDDALLVHYPMDNSWNDAWIYNFNGAANNSTFSTDSILGTHSGLFNGTNAYVNSVDSTMFENLSELTLEAWVKFNGAPSRTEGIITKSSPSANDRGFELYRSNTGYIGFLVPDVATGANRRISSQQILDNDWHHIVAVFKGGTALDIYIDGQLDNGSLFDGFPAVARANAATLKVGTRDTAWQEWLNGLLDDVRLYKRALSHDEIAEHFVRGGGNIINAPTVSTVSATVATSTHLLSGTKQSNSSIFINGVLAVPVDASTEWQYQAALLPGINNFIITSGDALGYVSQPVTSTIVYDNAAPAIVQSTPVNNSASNMTISNVSISFADAHSLIDLNATLLNSSVTDSLGQGVAGNWSASGADTVIFTPSGPFTESTYTVTVQPTDALGNTAAAQIVFTYDTTGPPAPVITSSISPTNLTQQAISGSRTLDTVAISASSPTAVFGATTYPNATSWSLNISGLTEGINTIEIYAIDAAGNYSLSASLNIELDTAPPVQPSVNQYSPIVNSASTTLTGVKEANSHLVVNGTVISTVPFEDTIWTHAFQLSEGPNSFAISSGDALGNQSSPLSVSIVRDTTAPYLLSTAPPANSRLNNFSIIEVSLADSYSDVDLQATVQGASVTVSSGLQVQGAWAVSNGKLVFTPQGSLPESGYTVRVYPKDSLGNSGTVSFTFTLDTTSPLLESFSMSPANPHKAESVTFVMTFNEDMLTSVQPDISFSKGLLYGSHQVSGNWVNSRRWQGSFSFTTGTGDGDYSVSLSDAKDLAQNVFTSQAIGTFILDTAAPSVPSVSTVTSPTSSPFQTLTGSKDADASVVINGIQRVSNLPASDTWSYNYPLMEGANNISIAARDEAGNDSAAASASITLDTTPPAFSVTSYLNPSTSVSQTISGTKEPGCTVKLNNSVIIEPSDTTSSWSHTVTLTEGITNRLVFSAADALGNSISKTIDILYDSSAPAPLPVGTVIADGSGMGSEVTLSWQAYVEPSDLAYYRIYYSNAGFTSVDGLTAVGTVNKGTRSFSVTGLLSGNTYYFAVVPVDASGNSDPSVHAVAAVPEDVAAPEDISNLAANAWHDGSSNVVVLSWTPSVNSKGDLADQVLYFDAGAGYDAGTSLGSAAVTYTKTGLADSVWYKFKITTKDAANHESAGVVKGAITRLPNPVGLLAAPGNGKVALSWNPVNSEYVKEYRLYRVETPSQATDIAAMALIKATTAMNYVDNGLVNGTIYQYAVTVVNTSGAERTSVQSISAAPRQDESGPSIDSVNVTANQVIAAPLDISASTHDDESAMDRVELLIDSALVKTQTGADLSYYWNILDHVDGNHTIKIVAYDIHGNSSVVTVPVIVSAAPPATPAITAHVVEQTSPVYTVSITGSAQKHTNISMRVNGTVIGQVLTETDGTFSFASIALVEGDNLVSAKAAHRGGESAFSSDYGITVDTGSPAVPIDLNAKPAPAGVVKFSWNNGEGEVPSGYNIYSSSSAFSSSSEPGVLKINTTAVKFLSYDHLPADDTLRYYAVAAVDSSGNESGLSGLVSLASDRSVPTATLTYSYTDLAGNNTNPASVAGPGSLSINLSASEPLSELPFLSLEAQTGSPVVVSLKKDTDTNYNGILTVNGLSPHGQTIFKFSGKDLTGNRGSSQGIGITFDVKGPQGTITSPKALQISSAAQVSILFDEPLVATPELSLTGETGTAVQVTGLSSTNNLAWTGTVDLTTLAEGTATFALGEVSDSLGNKSSTLNGGETIILYSITAPTPPVPAGLVAVAQKARGVALSWNPVEEAQSYRVFRRADGEPEASFIGTALAGANTFIDAAPFDGMYHYSVSSVGLLDSESGKSQEAGITADGTGPQPPSGLELTLTGAGAVSTWTAPSGETPASYKLYRSNAQITSVTGLSPVAVSVLTTATDPSPASASRFYAVTALDQLGNESAPSTTFEISFTVAPVKDLVLSKVDSGKPALTWSSSESDLQGYHVYRNAVRITQAPTVTAAYTDGYYSGKSVVYGVSQVNSLGQESPIKEVVFNELSIRLPEGTTLRRGILETVSVVLSSSMDTAVSTIEMSVGGGAQSNLSGPFVLTAGNSLTLQKVAATDANAPSQTPVTLTAVRNPSPGVTIRTTQTSLANVVGSGTALEIFSEPLTKGGLAKIQLKVNNVGTARMEFLTSQNGPTSEITVLLKDQDGNVLGQGNLDQRTDVINSSNYATARLNPGETFLLKPVEFNVPASAPYKVRIEAEIQNTYYQYNQAGMVVAPALKQSFETTISETAYSGTASVTKEVFRKGETVAITGQALSNNGEPAGLVPLKLGISIKGFDRFYTVNTDEQGNYSYTFVPGSGEAGTYKVWAVHPDVTTRTVQASFTVTGVEITPGFAEVRMSKNSSYDIPVSVKNLGDTSLTGMAFNASASSGLTVSALNSGSDVLAPNEIRSLKLRVSAASGAPATGFAILEVSANAGPETVSAKLNANVSLTQAVPVLQASPSYIDTGIVKNTQKIESFTIKNTGLDALKNARIEGPFLPWLSLAVNKSIGDISPGASTSVGLIVKPSETLAQGIYEDKLVIYSDNHIPYTYNIQVTVTSSSVGNLLFDVLNELMEDVVDANILLQHQAVPDLLYTARTGADGTVSIFDIPEGRYTFSVSALGHSSYSGSISVVPGLTVAVPVALEVSLIDVEWSVVPITIEDRYEIRISQTFQTNVPTSVIVVEPASVTVPDIKPGEVFNGEFTITNYGLISASYKGIKVPASAGDYDIEVLASFPETIGAMQKVTVPYRITRRLQ